MENTDYSELDGRKVVVTEKNLSGEKISDKRKVVACSYYVGITIQAGSAKLCINGPSSPHWGGYCRTYDKWEEKYDDVFAYCLESIENGEIDVNHIYDMLEQQPIMTGTPSCAYSGQ